MPLGAAYNVQGYRIGQTGWKQSTKWCLRHCTLCPLWKCLPALQKVFTQQSAQAGPVPSLGPICAKYEHVLSGQRRLLTPTFASFQLSFRKVGFHEGVQTPHVWYLGKIGLLWARVICNWKKRFTGSCSGSDFVCVCVCACCFKPLRYFHVQEAYSSSCGREDGKVPWEIKSYI